MSSMRAAAVIAVTGCACLVGVAALTCAAIARAAG